MGGGTGTGPKSLEELNKWVTEISGKAKRIEGKNYLTTHIPISEIVVGGTSHSYENGYVSRLEIELINSDPTSPVKKLTFNGNSPLQSGQEIRAYIFKGIIEESPLPLGPSLAGRTRKSKILERDLKEEEKALYIKILGSDGKKILRTDYSVDYNPIYNFFEFGLKE